MTSSVTAPPAPVVPAGTAAAPPPRLRLVRYEPEPGEEACAVPGPAVEPPPVTEPLPPDAPARPAVVGVLRLALEVLDGRRPFPHLVPHLGPRAQRYWRAVAATGSRPDAAKIVRVLLCRPSASAVEATAVCRIGARTRALAARFEAGPAPTGWRCTVLRLG
ncbi:MAG TPA: Rv3235 family protein [Pseudonocardia sp.]|nr:Rv3235 family protein [Pseudonocardia sp.]